MPTSDRLTLQDARMYLRLPVTEVDSSSRRKSRILHVVQPPLRRMFRAVRDKKKAKKLQARTRRPKAKPKVARHARARQSMDFLSEGTESTESAGSAGTDTDTDTDIDGDIDIDVCALDDLPALSPAQQPFRRAELPVLGFHSVLRAGDQGLLFSVRCDGQRYVAKWIPGRAGEREADAYRRLRGTEGLLHLEWAVTREDVSLRTLFPGLDEDEYDHICARIRDQLACDNSPLRFNYKQRQFAAGGEGTVLLLEEMQGSVDLMFDALPRREVTRRAKDMGLSGRVYRSVRPVFERLRELGMVHGDVFPRNLLYRDTGGCNFVFRIGDFGSCGEGTGAMREFDRLVLNLGKL